MNLMEVFRFFNSFPGGNHKLFSKTMTVKHLPADIRLRIKHRTHNNYVD